MPKILLVGNVDGKFDYLFEKITLLSSKGQNFDLLFCVGNTLSFTFQIKPYVSKEKVFPIPTYFIDASELSFSLNELFPNGVEICPNFTFLGRSGIKEIMGLKVAYLNGIKNEMFPKIYHNQSNINLDFSGCYYTKKDLDNLKQEYETQNSENSYIDFFLTNEWPLGFENGLVEFPKSIQNNSFYVSELANILNPRYHIVSLENIFFQRRPYLNQSKIMTRLIALAGVPDPNNKNFKEKYLLALQVTPATQMDKNLLQEISEDITPNPYDQKVFALTENQKENDNEEKKREEEIKKVNEMTENCKLFVKGFDFRTKDDEIYEFLNRFGPIESLQMVYDPYTKKHKGYGFFKFINIKDMKKALIDSNKFALNGRKIFFGLENKPLKPKSQDCWFCLSNEKTDKSLIFYVCNDVYLALDKGPIVKRHLQIIPIDHYDKSILLPTTVAAEIKTIKNRLLKIFNESYNENVIFYERAVKLKNDISHMLIHCVPLPLQKSKEFIDGFENLVKKNKLNFFKIKELEDLKDFCEDDDLYVYLEIFFENITYKYACNYNERDPNFARTDVLREIICEILQLPERMKWKDCLLLEQEKSQLIIELKNRYNEKF